MQEYVEGKRKRGRPNRDGQMTYTQLSLENLLEKSWRRDEWKIIYYERRNVPPTMSYVPGVSN